MCDASLQEILLISTPVSGDHMHSPVVESHAFGLKPGYGRLLHEQLLITSSLCRLRDRLRLLVYVPDAVSAFLALAWALSRRWLIGTITAMNLPKFSGLNDEWKLHEGVFVSPDLKPAQEDQTVVFSQFIKDGSIFAEITPESGGKGWAAMTRRS